MDLQTSIELQKRISNQFLFSRQRQLAYAGDWENEVSPSDLVYDIFESIFGVAIGGSDDTGYYIKLLTDDENLYMAPIREYFNANSKTIVPSITAPFELRSRKRPLEIGCSVSHRLNNIMGTLGCFVKRLDDEKTYILSNHHVLYNSEDLYDNFIVQPCTLEGANSKDAIGLYYQSLAFNHSDINEYDAAIAGPISSDIKPEIPSLNKQINGSLEAKNKRKVYKIGAKTDITYGRISSFLTNIRVKIDGERYDFANQILIKGCNKNFTGRLPFSEPGDSGSLIIDYDTDLAVGLLFAGNDRGDTLANPIKGVLAKLDIRF